MMATPHPQNMTVEAYLEWEPRQERRYEYGDGVVLAMAGGTRPHNDIAINFLTALRPHVRVQGCRINIADAKVKVSPSLYRYPDVGVSCDERDLSALQAIQFPKLIVEVLSPGTEAFDLGLKFKEYRSLPSLEEYLLSARPRSRSNATATEKGGSGSIIRIKRATSSPSKALGLRGPLTRSTRTFA